MKKLLACLLIAAMLIPSLAGCGKGAVEPDPAAARERRDQHGGDKQACKQFLHN